MVVNHDTGNVAKHILCKFTVLAHLGANEPTLSTQVFDLLFVVHDESKHKPMVFVTMASLTRQFGREYPEDACRAAATRA